jgi:hypothetical protein
MFLSPLAQRIFQYSVAITLRTCVNTDKYEYTKGQLTVRHLLQAPLRLINLTL